MPSFTQKILEGFNTLLEKVSADEEPLSGVDAAALNAELEARAAAREAAGGRAPVDNPRAKLAAPGDETRARRAKLANERETRIRGERARHEAEAKRKQEEAFRRMAEEARRQAAADARARASAGPRPGATGGARPGGARPGGTSGARPGAGSRARSAFTGGGRRGEIASAYRTLDLPEGADFAQVKSAYRKLMRRYHPDLHGQSPKKQKAATELSMQVTRAYELLERHLQGK